MKGLGVDSRTPTFLNSGISDWEDIREPGGSCRGPRARVLSCWGRYFIRVDHRPHQILGSGDAKFKVYKVRVKLPVCISVSPVHSLDYGACHKHNLVGAGETIRQCIAWPFGQPACGFLSSTSAPRFPKWLLIYGRLRCTEFFIFIIIY